jgi:hypothetical protein
MNSPTAIQTASGRYFDVLDQRVEDIEISNISETKTALLERILLSSRRAGLLVPALNRAA